jgi:hypothetical protein
MIRLSELRHITSLEDRASPTRPGMPIHRCWSQASNDPWLTVSAPEPRGIWLVVAHPIGSVSGNFVGRACFRILTMTCGEWSARVRWCLPTSAAIVTQLVTRSSESSCLTVSARWSSGHLARGRVPFG